MSAARSSRTAIAILLAAILLVSALDLLDLHAAEPRGPLSPAEILKMLEGGTDSGVIVQLIDEAGLERPPSLEEVLALKEAGADDAIFAAINRASAAGRQPAPGKRPPDGPLTAADIKALLQQGTPEDRLIETIRLQGVDSPLSLDEVVDLKQSGATDRVFAAINRALSVTLPGPEEELREEPVKEPPVVVLTAPPPVTPDEILVTSVPSRLRVFISPSGTRRDEVFDHAFLVGLTPLSISLDPGRYNVVVQKEATEFDESLVPAWPTVHDTPDTISLLGDADLVFDPDHCCLPGSLDGTVRLQPLPRRSDAVYVGEAFGGLPPYVLDGESLQVLRLRDASVAQVLKLYHLRKNAHQARVLTATFIPASDDPLDPDQAGELPLAGTFDPYLDADLLGYLRDDDLAEDAALALGLDASVWTRAIAMLRRAGKATIRQPAESGERLVTLSLEGSGRLRLDDRTILPTDPFATKPAAPQEPATPPAELPALQRVVVPGLGLPHLVVENTLSEARALILDDGQFFFVPAGATREFVVDPGTYAARLASPVEGGTVSEGRLHFSYHARYRLGL